ncbi:MAG: nucleotidyl transferase AbiEii/AbiGii toxin family protein [Deltaproteobacteria bacterium]|nr:nucleotidyl transferase AbiEii/AbiGii toxin family protein [Deltaproteobacteria bacterium]
MPFKPRTDILPKAQQSLWKELAAVPKDFVLYGGTAIALHLGHRQSVDFDFFGGRSFRSAELFSSIPFLSGAEILQQEKDTLTCLVDVTGPVKVSFFGVPQLGRVAPPVVCPDNQLQIASLMDLAGTKAAVVQQRSEAKDYVDMDAIIASGVSLLAALSAAIKIYKGQFNPQITLKALCFFGDGDLASLDENVRKRLLQAVKSVDLSQLK